MAALIQPVSDRFQMVSEGFRSSQCLQMEKSRQTEQQGAQTGTFGDWEEPQ